MKIFFVLFTLLFSVTVLADCCNFEVAPSTVTHDYAVDSDHGHSQHETDADHGSSAEHCHCSPINHFKILHQDKTVLSLPTSTPTEASFPAELRFCSFFESAIFHPPIA